MVERSYRGLLWTLVLLATTLDQAGKYGVFNWLYNEGRGGQQVIIPGVFMLLAQFPQKEQYATDPEIAAPAKPAETLLASLRTLSGPVPPKVNPGALFGLGGERGTLPHAIFGTVGAWFGLDPAPMANAVFAAVSLLAVLAIAYWSTRRSTASDWSLCAALGLIMAGTLGNLYDRLVFNGVRDFLYFHWFEFPVFNIADSCLVCGAFLLLIQALWSRPAAAAHENAAAAMPAASVQQV